MFRTGWVAVATRCVNLRRVPVAKREWVAGVDQREPPERGAHERVSLKSSLDWASARNSSHIDTRASGGFAALRPQPPGAQHSPGRFLLCGSQLPSIHPRCCATSPLLVKECQMSKSQCLRKTQIRNRNLFAFFARLGDSAALRQIQATRATPSYQTCRNPKYFPNSLKTDQISRVSSKVLNF